MTATMKVPKLRFPEFSDEWKVEKFGELTKFQQGVQVDVELQSKEPQDGYVKFLRIENYTQNSQDLRYVPNDLAKNKTINENEIAVVRYGATAGFIGRGFNGVLANNLFKLVPNSSILDTNYLFQYLKSHKVFSFFQSEMAGGAMPALSFGIVQVLKIPYPSIHEQTKIATFLTAIDTKIDQLTKKQSLLKQYKKGVMQKLFSQELRFKADDGSEFPEWEEKTLGDLLDYLQPTKYLVDSTEYNDSYQTPVLTAGKTFILGYTDETIGIFNDNLPVIIFDDFTTATKFVDFPFKAKSSAMKILIPNNNVNIKFVYEAMQIMRYEIGGHERHWISKYSQLYISIPSIKEQNKITTFLTSIDTKIDLVTKQLDATKQFKKALLQQMFV